MSSCEAVAIGKFQSTLPVWGATRAVSHIFHFRNISIHAPRVGSDQFTLWGRRMRLFQSTLPVWGATAKLHKYFLKFYRI